MATPLLPQVEAMDRHVKPYIIGKRAGFDLLPRTVKVAIDKFPRSDKFQLSIWMSNLGNGLK